MKPRFGYLALWVLLFYFVFVEMNAVARNGNFDELYDLLNFKSRMLTLSSILSCCVYAFVPYLTLHFLKKHVWLQVILLICTPFIGMWFRIILEEYVYLAVLGFDNYKDGFLFKYYFFDNLYYAIVFTSLGIVYFFIQISKYKEQQRQELLLQNKQTELAFLRSQINPHFLFNTMNNIYTLVYKKSDKALKAMEKLTNLLRYALYEPAHMVSFSKEFDCIQDFINLQLMRYDFEVAMSLEVGEDLEEVKIPPFIFIPFFENAFKHGSLNDENSPIEFIFERNENYLIFKTKNGKQQKQKDQQGGIGLENIKKRLELIYQEKHTLKINDTENEFSVFLKIPISQY